ncbi:MAG: hypothetical protein HQK86_01565 [Nitrospinae bacterium]|nr:hypothetical protein [Nitrospinota bacterium]MBF0633516.1 hypothetical protein [Nitrospinota bacterium]
MEINAQPCHREPPHRGVAIQDNPEIATDARDVLAMTICDGHAYQRIKACNVSISRETTNGAKNSGGSVMQHRYAGDVGDFGKFFLLRRLAHALNLRLGVIWYLFPDESHNNDGRHINYFDKTRFHNIDNELLKILRDVSSLNEKRSVRMLESVNVAPAGSVFFSDYTFAPDNQNLKLSPLQERGRLRKDWVKSALSTVSTCPMVFLDPDNGIEPVSGVSRNSKLAGKYALMDEITAFAAHHRVTVIYHHLGRQGKHVEQQRFHGERLANIGIRDKTVMSVRFSAYSPRAYFIIAEDKVSKTIWGELEKLTSSERLKNLWDGALAIR